MKLKQWIQIFPILSGIMWGSAGIFVRKLSELGLNSVSIVETRIIVAIIIIIAGLLCLDKKLLKIKLKDLWIFICAGIFSMLGLNLCYNFAINELTLSLSAVLLSLAPIFVLILASILFKEKLTLQKTVCAILALIGSIFSKIAMLKGYHSFTVTIYSLMAVGIALLPFTDWLKVWEIIQIDPAPMSGFLLLHSLLTSVLPYICFTVALNYVEAGKVAILASGEPIAAMLFGIFFYQEIPTILSLIGLFTVLFALGLLTIPFTKLKKIFN